MAANCSLEDSLYKEVNETFDIEEEDRNSNISEKDNTISNSSNLQKEFDYKEFEEENGYSLKFDTKYTKRPNSPQKDNNLGEGNKKGNTSIEQKETTSNNHKEIYFSNLQSDNRHKPTKDHTFQEDFSYSKDLYQHDTFLPTTEIELVCGICKQTYHHPRVLDCLHTFCEECCANNITKIYNESGEVSVIRCHVCFEATALPSNDLSMLPYNFFANNAIDYLLIQSTKENAILCTCCDDEADAISRCVDCSEFLCLKCVTAHRRIRVTKEHRIQDLDTLRYDKSSVHRPVHCPQHEPEVFAYFCDDCQELICNECTILQHRGHQYERLSEALQRKKPSIMNVLEDNELHRIPPIEKAIDEVQDMAARLHARTVATKQAVKNCTAQCIRAIEFRCHELLATVDSVYAEKSQLLFEQLKALQLKLAKNKSANDFVTYAFKNGSEAEIFELLDMMQLRLSSLNREPLEYAEPHENDVIDHVFDLDAVENIARNLGDISTSSIFLAHTKVSGTGLRTGKVGIETSFQIEVFDRFQKPCTETTVVDTIRVKVQAPEGFYINNKVSVNEEGAYVVRYTPVTKGKHGVVIKIRGRPFPNNQHTVKVHDGIDYLKIESTYLNFGHLGNKPGEMNQPWGVAAHEDGSMLVTDHGNNRVQVFDHLGGFVTEFGSKGSKEGQFQGPTGICIDRQGVVFVSDWENHRIQMFSQTGNYLGKFGSKGREKGQLLHPAGLALDKNGCLVVVERDNHRLQIFNMDGRSLLTIGQHGSEPGHLDSPTHVAVREDNVLVVTDSANNRISLFESTGRYITSTGYKGCKPGNFNRPSGVCVDREGYVIVGDFHNHRVQVFSTDLRHYCTFGEEGTKDKQFRYPSGATLTCEGRVAIVDRYNHRMQVF